MPSSKLLFLALAAATLHINFTFAIPVDNSGNAYSGKGGKASGGDVDNKDGGLLGILDLDLFSGNAGPGGLADSGNAIGGPIRSERGGEGGGDSDNNGNAYSGDGGRADGGSVDNAGGLININSNNAGPGGDARSGDAHGGVAFSDDADDRNDGGHHDYDYDHDHEHGGGDCHVCALDEK